jgi:hypothetical protein
MSNFLDLAGTSNVFRQSYVNGFIDVLGTTVLRSDVSMNGRLSVLADSSFNGNVNVNGNVTINGIITCRSQINGVSFNATSDYRIKENVKPLDNTYIVNNIRPVKYHNKLMNREDIGLIAHELQEIYPSLVTGEKDGEMHQTVNYIGLIPILINDLQQLKKSILVYDNSLNDVVTSLQVKNVELENKLQQLVSRLDSAGI